jgi:iron complex outermembrane receptor protein
VRIPSRIERDLVADTSVSPTSPVFARIQGDEGFTAERVIAYEAGYRVQPADRLSLELAVFHNRYGDLLSIESGPPFLDGGRRILPLRIQNRLHGRASGLELTTATQFSPRWTIHAAYAYLDLSLEAKPGSTDTTSTAAEKSSPRHQARIQSSWSLPGDLDVDVGFRWVDKLPTQKVPAYSELDARVAWRVVPKLQLAVVGQSLLHEHHFEFGSSPSPIGVERSLYGEARWGW